MRRGNHVAILGTLVLVTLAAGRLSTRANAQGLPQARASDPSSPTSASVEPAPPAYYPSHYGARPLTLPQLTLRAATELRVLHLDFSRFNPLVGVEVSAGVGVTDDFELGLGSPALAPVVAATRVIGTHLGLGGWLRPEVSRGMLPPTLYARYRVFATDRVEVGVEFDGILPANGGSGGFALGVPLRVRPSPSFVVDAAVGVLVILGDGAFGGGSTDVVMSFSVMPRYAHDLFYVGLDTGLFFFTADANDVFVPILMEVGGTLRIAANTLDVYARGGFPLLFASDSGDAAYPETWEVSIGVRGYFDLRAPNSVPR